MILGGEANKAQRTKVAAGDKVFYLLPNGQRRRAEVETVFNPALYRAFQPGMPAPDNKGGTSNLKVYLLKTDDDFGGERVPAAEPAEHDALGPFIRRRSITWDGALSQVGTFHYPEDTRT